MPTVADLDQTHPEYDPAYFNKLSALYLGGRVWRKSAHVWLPPRHAEEMGEYTKRLAGVCYENKAGPVVDTIAQWLNEEPLVVADSALADALAAPSGATPLASVVAEVLTNALVLKRGWVYVTLPTTSASTRGEQRRAGDLQPEYRVIDSANVLDWEIDSRGRVVWAMIRELVESRAGPAARRRWQIEWTYVSATMIQKFRLPLEDDQVADAAILGAERLKGLIVQGDEPVTPPSGCPLACLVLPDALWAMDRLADPAAGHLRTSHALDWLLDKSAFSILLIQSKHEGLNSPTVGPGYALKVGIDDDAKYIEPTGVAFTALRDTKLDYEQAIYRTMRQMALATRTDSGGGPASGAAKARDMDPLRIVLSAFRAVVLTFGERLVRLAAGVVDARVPDDLALSGLDAWRERTLDEFFVAASLAMDAIAMSETLGRAVAKTKAQMLLAGTPGAVDLEKIEYEINQADPMEALVIGGKSLGDDVAATLAGTTGGEKDERAADDKRKAQRKSGQGAKGAKRP